MLAALDRTQQRSVMEIVRQAVVDDLNVGIVDQLFERGRRALDLIASSDVGNFVGVTAVEGWLNVRASIAQPSQGGDMGFAKPTRPQHRDQHASVFTITRGRIAVLWAAPVRP